MNIDVRFVRNVLTPHFGPLVTAVACALIKRGRQTVSQLARTAAHPPSVVRGSLVVLIQHGLVVYYAVPDSSQVYYSLCEDRVQWRLRIPRYIKAAHDRYSDDGKHVMVQVLLNGRHSLKQVLANPSSANQSNVRNVFVQMVHDRYLIPSILTSALSSVDTRLAVEHKIKDALGPMPQAREIKELDRSTRHEMAVSELENAIQVGLKRKPGVSTTEYSHKAYKAWEINADQPYCVNHAYLHMHLRHEMMSKLAETKLNPTGSTIFRGVVDLIHQQTILSTCSNTLLPGLATTKSEDNETPGPVVTPAQVQNKVALTDMHMDYGGIAMDPTQSYEDYLDMLDHHSLLRKDSFRTAYSLPLARDINRVLGMYLAELYVGRRFGKIGTRVFRALSMRGKLEEKQICTMVMQPMAVVRHACYQLHLAGFVELLPIPKSADRAPARTIYVYAIDVPGVSKALRFGIKHALCNLMERMNELLLFSKSALLAAARKRKRALMFGNVTEDDADAQNLVLKNDAAKITIKIAIMRLELDLVVFEAV